MAKKEEASKVILERNYNIPLRKETLKAPKYRKAKKAVTAVREFITQHMKPQEIKIGRYLNLKIWEHGIKNPPHHVKVTATKDDKGKVLVELTGAPKEQPKVEEKKPVKKEEKKPETKAEKQEEKIEKKIEEAKEEKAEEAKKIEKEEIKELQKEHPKTHPQKMPQVQKSQQVHPTAPKSV